MIGFNFGEVFILKTGGLAIIERNTGNITPKTGLCARDVAR